ncbi:MAG: hypothetical protein ABJP48_03775 [Erythrobacter sp.]
MASATQGSTIHRSSEKSVSSPRIEKKFAPIGETLIGVTGANIRALSNGHHKAAPSPPSVSVSNKP